MQKKDVQLTPLNNPEPLFSGLGVIQAFSSERSKQSGRPSHRLFCAIQLPSAHCQLLLGQYPEQTPNTVHVAPNAMQQMKADIEAQTLRGHSPQLNSSSPAGWQSLCPLHRKAIFKQEPSRHGNWPRLQGQFCSSDQSLHSLVPLHFDSAGTHCPLVHLY